MAPPLVNLLRPASGWSAGGELVQLDGLGFRMPLAPARPAGGPVPKPAPTVEVLFDGVPSPRVEVVSQAILRCETPRHSPTRIINDVQETNGTVSVVVRNLDANGDPIPGESFTLPNAYTYVRPRLGTAEVRGSWLRVLDAFLEHWRDLVVEAVEWNPALDYDAETNDVRGYVELATLPGIAVTRVAFPPSETETEGGPFEVQAGSEAILVQRPPMANDMTFTLVLVSNHPGELVNLAEVVGHVFSQAATFHVPCVDDPTQAVEYSMLLTAPIQFSERIGNTNVLTAEATGLVQRVLSDALPGAPTAGLPGIPAAAPHQATRSVTRHLDRVNIAFGRKL